MMLLFFTLSVGLLGMYMVPVRHLARVRSIDGESEAHEQLSDESIVRARVVALIEIGEQWYHYRAKEEFLKLLDRMLKVFERGAGQVAGQTKHLRIMVQERFKVIPRESLYWKQVHAWKKEAVLASSPRRRFEDDGQDVSNHHLI